MGNVNATGTTRKVRNVKKGKTATKHTTRLQRATVRGSNNLIGVHYKIDKRVLALVNEHVPARTRSLLVERFWRDYLLGKRLVNVGDLPELAAIEIKEQGGQ